MVGLEKRIRKGVKEILKAKEQGKDTSEWENHLMKLLDELSNKTVKVRIGHLGFCTCSISKGLCTGCWKIKQSCECMELEVDPEVELTRQFHARIKGYTATH